MRTALAAVAGVVFTFVALLNTPGPPPPAVLAAASKVPEPQKVAEPPDLIDGAKDPERIPDDQAYHLVLMAASAADDGSEVEKARAEAVRATILRQLPDDVPELAEVANLHRKTLTGLLAEAAAGNADAERLKSEHLGRVQAETNLRLPATTRAALAAYVNGEKANMKIFGIDRQQVAAMPKLLETGFTALGYCDNDAGSLAPYCRDNCSGARPCDKKCRRDDESCTTCGQYGVCCCLGGGGGGGDPTPTPTPTPPPEDSMSGEPTGTIYRNVTFGSGAVMYATAVTDTAASCSCHSSSASVRITTPSGGIISSSTGVVGALAHATASYQSNVLSSGQEERVPVATEHTSFCPIRNITFLQAWPSWPDIFISIAITNYIWTEGGNPTEGPICEYWKWCAMGTTSCPADNPVLVDSRLSPCKNYLYDFRLKSKIGDGPWRCWPIGRAVLADNWAPCT